MTTISSAAGVAPHLAPAVRSAPPATEAAQLAPSAPAVVPPPASFPLVDGAMAALVAEQSAAAGVADLRGQDLRQLDLRSLDLRGADLSGANLSGLDLSGIDFTGAKLDGAALVGATLKGAKLDGASAIGADFSDATLVNTTIDGADFSQANFDRVFIGKDGKQDIAVWDVDRYLIANSVKLDGASFRGAHLQGVAFVGASAIDADFSSLHADVSGFRASILQGANFDGVSGRRLSFAESDLSGAALTNSILKHLSISSTTLAGTRFAGSSLNGVGLSFTNLSVADLTGVAREAKAASFNNVNLDGIDFSGFDFTGAHFNGDPPRWTNPDHRDVQGAGPSMNGTRFDGAKFEFAWFQGIDTSAGSFAGATFNATAQGKSAKSLSGVAGVGDWSLERYVQYQAQRGVSIPAPGAGQGGGLASQRSFAGAAVDQDGMALAIGADEPELAHVVDQAAALALDALTSINAQMREARMQARVNEGPWERLMAAETDQGIENRLRVVV
ncbi:MAG: hypothetical protein C0481_10840 [Phenylobacterium sp.]|uniref:pentapeptide repeat-containing protein n=1 Tax=Phenylobacterium sp. TaxID=1871053 RepID=UPI0025DD79F4|nr:pentapeptide repeat-containing protein [Phenylobacterium sp.]MBA4012351.1 hypothetical protein [Phenylobacterium sp.]